MLNRPALSRGKSDGKPAPMVDGTTRLSRLAVLALLRAQCVSGGALQLQHRDRSDAGSAFRVVGEAPSIDAMLRPPISTLASSP